MSDAHSLEIQLAIGRVAMGILTEPYRGAKLAEYEPRRKTAMHDAWHGGRLSERHQRAWRMTMNIFEDAAGISPRNGGYGEATGGGGGEVVPMVYNNRAQALLERLVNQHLHTHERRLLMTLVTENFQAVRLYRLEQLGNAMDGYADKAQARAAAIGGMHRLLESLCEFFSI